MKIEENIISALHDKEETHAATGYNFRKSIHAVQTAKNVQCAAGLPDEFSGQSQLHRKLGTLPV
ncbi:hypothetical protein [Methylovulum psychrotolerans]|uniref:hypothetical protein n=1 Tax=Methylovulum psychrotolerans TaxID=1704499 RepID=UPI0012FC5C29|nr:hypothetical protein [Methylovulum psychrotolerans]